MKQARCFAVLVTLMLLAGCAVFDIGSHETAVPQQPGEWELEPYAGIGLPVDLLNRNSDELDDWYLSEYLLVAMVYPVLTPEAGLRTSVAVSPQTEFTGRAFASGAGTNCGLKLGVKTLVSEKSGTSFTALQPSLTVLMPGLALGIFPDPDSLHGPWAASAVGAELMLLSTKKFSDFGETTFSARLNFEHITYRPEEGEPYKMDTVHLGLGGNKRYRAKFATMAWGVGVEIFPPIGRALPLMPYLNLGLIFHLGSPARQE